MNESDLSPLSYFHYTHCPLTSCYSLRFSQIKKKNKEIICAHSRIKRIKCHQHQARIRLFVSLRSQKLSCYILKNKVTKHATCYMHRKTIIMSMFAIYMYSKVHDIVLSIPNPYTLYIQITDIYWLSKT